MAARADQVTDRGMGRARNASLMLIVLGLIIVLVIPLPVFVLDLLITLNITGSLLILMATLSSRSPLQFSTFPSVLLFTALLRLALNVASTRLILLQGDAGTVISSFGEFVIAGNPVIGVVIFLILIIIQFIVIVRGQNRISEVTARFTLDAMPGKQMAIDADLAAGAISNEEAKAARADLQQEAQFYGAMDGAGKFIRGDAMAGMIITLVNIIGGIALGMLIRNMEFGQAVDFYTILTVGDGLASQLPGLVVSVASGILVTKASSKRDLAEEVYSQIFGSKPTLLATGLLLLVFALVPGFPRIPFLILGGTFLFAAGRMKAGAAGEQREQAEIEREEPSEEERIEDLLHVDRLGIEIGYRLISIVDPGRHGSLLEHIAALRRQFAGTLGVVIPPIRVKDNVQLDPNEYRILLMGQEVGRGELRAGHYLAMDPTGSAPPVEGVETIEPSFGLPARWVSESNKEQAEILGYTAIDAPSVLITHLTEVLKRIAHELISRDDVQALLDNVKKANPAIVEEIIPNVLSTSQVQRVLTALLKERCSVRNLALILEAMADAADDSKEPRHLVESTRMRLARSIVEPYLDEQGDLHVATIQPHLEGQLLAALAGQGDQETIAQGMLAQFVDNTARVLAEFVRKGWAPVLVTRAGLRPYLSEAVVTAVPGSAVMSYQEISTVKQVDVAAQVSLEGAAA